MRPESFEKVFKAVKKFEDDMHIIFVLHDGTELKIEGCVYNSERQFVGINAEGANYYYVDLEYIRYVRVTEKDEDKPMGFKSIQTEIED